MYWMFSRPQRSSSNTIFITISIIQSFFAIISSSPILSFVRVGCVGGNSNIVNQIGSGSDKYSKLFHRSLLAFSHSNHHNIFINLCFHYSHHHQPFNPFGLMTATKAMVVPCNNKKRRLEPNLALSSSTSCGSSSSNSNSRTKSVNIPFPLPPSSSIVSSTSSCAKLKWKSRRYPTRHWFGMIASDDQQSEDQQLKDQRYHQHEQHEQQQQQQELDIVKSSSEKEITISKEKEKAKAKSKSKTKNKGKKIENQLFPKSKPKKNKTKLESNIKLESKSKRKEQVVKQETIIINEIPSSYSSSNNNNNNSSSSNVANEQLNNWVTHSNSSYHDLTPSQALNIRNALLKWYRIHRRKLPWRGDIGPFNGSTAGIASGKSGRRGSSNRNRNSNKDGSGSGSGSSNGVQTMMDSFIVSNNQKKENNYVEVLTEKRDNIGTSKKDDDNDDDDEMETIKTALLLPVTAYGVWVSEIMCQQTRVEAVVPYYLKWMKSFPTVQSLANASPDDINSHWAGLGFYRRARYLHSGAKYVVDNLNGTLPSSVDELMKIDGIGRYTASAISSIAFNTCVPVVDGNVCRVLSRLTGVANHIKASVFKDDIGWKIAEQIVKAGDGRYAGEVNQALMELGATYCAPSGTGTDLNDPLVNFYLSTDLGRGLERWIRAYNCDSDVIIVPTIEDFVGRSGKKCGSYCNLCEPGGVDNVLLRISENLYPSVTGHDTHLKGNNGRRLLQKQMISDQKNISHFAAVAGHAAFPTVPPKKAKREEVLAVAAISRGKEWLMTRRPKKGLLAGQWEFPSVVVWTSVGTAKKGTNSKSRTQQKVPTPVSVPTVPYMERREAMNRFLNDPLFDDILSRDRALLMKKDIGWREVGDEPIEHIFSHVRHTMWVEFVSLKDDDDRKVVGADEQEVRWMSKEAMGKVGITSGVRKVLTVVSDL